MKFKKNINYNTRKIHRYLGVIIGIQFLFWTIGGLYFSWNNMDDVHGETLIKQEKKYVKNINFSQIQKGIDSLEIDSIRSIHLIEVFGKPLTQFKYYNKNHLKTQLITETGKLRSAFSAQESLKLVEQQLKEPIPIIKTEYLTQNDVGNHHEYREKPLPVYAFTLDHPTKTTIYVSPELGEITSVRNNNWRRFDFLWMLHTMDYSTRDEITNWALRILSVFGILTIFSGFSLFYLTSQSIKKMKKKASGKNS
ncbi:hypothetical protein [Lutibacter sp.]